jgi:hypothetical protein
MEQAVLNTHPAVYMDRLNRKWKGEMHVIDFKDGHAIIILECNYFNIHSVFSYDHRTGNLIKLPPEDSILILSNIDEAEEQEEKREKSNVTPISPKIVKR